MAGHGVGDFFALDIGTNAVRVVQLTKNGTDSWNLVHYGYAAADEKITSSDAVEGKRGGKSSGKGNDEDDDGRAAQQLVLQLASGGQD